MNVCINEQSIKDFVKLFKSQAKLINNKTIQSKEQLYKKLYNAALMKSGDANSQSNIDLVVQHMLFLPIALNGSFPGLNIEADLAKTMTAMNSTKAVSDLIKDYQKLIVDTIDVEENPIEYNDENIVDFSKFNPVHVEVLTNQTPEFTGTEKKLDPNQTEAFAFVRAIIGDVKELTETPYKVLAIKLGAANALLNKLGLEVDRSLIGGSVTSPQALVFLMTDANGKIISYNTKTNQKKKVVLFSSYTNTPKLLFEGYDWKKSFAEQKGFADTTANKKIRNVQEKLATAIAFNNKELEPGKAMQMAFEQLANEFKILNDINEKTKDKAEGFLLDVNPTTSNFGYINQNSDKETKITDVKDYNQFDVTTKQELTENGKVKFEFFALTGHTLHDVPVSLYPTSLDTNPELINALVELLTNPNLAVNGAVQTDEQRMDLFKKYVNIDSKTPIKFKKDNSISVSSKSFKLFDEGLKEALTDHFTKFSVKQEFVGKTEGKNIVTDIAEVKSKNDLFRTTSGKVHTVGKPNFSFKIKPENTYKMEGDNLILTPISRNAHIINNSYTIAETSADNELRVYHPRIGFSLGTVVPVTAEKEVEVEVEDEVTPAEDVEPTPPTFEDNDDYADELLAANTIELETVTEKAEAAALKWFKAHDMSSELDLEFTDKKHPHALAQWFTSGITLYKGSNNTLIYHEAWHAFTQGILTKEQKNKLYFEVKKSYPNENFKNDKEVEEFLAEKFRAYAMDKISPKGNLLQQFFKNLLDAITKIFKRKTLTDKYFKDLVDNKVDFTKYNPEANMFWGRMNASITAFSDPKNGKLDAAQSKLIVDTVNTLVNEAYSEKIKNGSMKITTLDDVTPLYKHAKLKLIEIKESQLKIQEDLSKVSNPDAAQKMKIAQVAKQVEALTFSIAEFGNLEDIEKNISETGANTGVIGAHISSGLFITQQGLKSIAEEDTDRDETDPFKERKDISLEEYADKEILMLLSTVPDFDEKGNKVTNALGVHLLSNKVKVLSIVAKQTMSSANPDTMFATLKNSKDPIIQEVLKRMPLVNGELPIHLGSQILWSKFFQTFSKSNMPLKQLLFERVNDGKEVGINLKYGSVSSSTTQVRNNWNTAFESTPNIDVDIHGPYLNVKKALEWLEANPKATPAQKFNALGVNITDTKEVNKILQKGNKDSGIPAGMLDDFIARLKNDTSINTTDFEKRINNITDLIKDYSVLNVDEQGNESYEKVKGLGGFYKTLQEVEFKYSNNYNSFMGTNAEGETASELVLNSSITHMINEMNNAKTLPDLIGNNAFEHLDGNVDPFKKANTFLSEMFDEDGNRQTTKQGNVKLEYENFSGTKYFEKIIGDNEFENIVERGLSNMSLDENSKFITDVYLSYFGKAEAPRMADKASSFHFGLSNFKAIFNLTAAKAIKSQADTNDVMYNALEKYLAAEIVRINTLGSAKGNIDKKYKARGQEFFIFDALLTGPTKTNLKDNIKSTNFDEVLSEVRKSRTTLTKEINQYFKEKTDITLKNKKDTFYLAEGVRKELSGNAKTKLPIDESKELLISMFERNQFLNYLNFTTLFLGDPALYDVTKEDFHKRIAGVISTGEGFRHDLSMLETLNTLPFKSGGVVENNKSRNYAQSRIKDGFIKPKQEFREYDGTVVTAIINDHKVNSVYLDELAKDIKNLVPYSEMNEADGQGFISFDFYRMLSISQGLWSPVKEAMYNNIVNGAPFDQTRVSEFFESMKLQHFGPVKTDGLPGMAFHKFNLIPLIPNMIKGTKLEDLHDKMMEQGIDYMTFASGSKLTSVSNSESESPNDDYYNKETRETTTDVDFKFTPNIIHVKYLKNQIKIHNEFKGKIPVPTQMRAILYAGLMDNGVPKDVNAMFELQGFDKKDFQSKWEAFSETEKLKSKDYTWLKKYEDTINGIVSFKKQELFNELGITEEADISRSSEKLANLIRSELTRSEIDDAQIDFLFNNSALKTDISLALTEGQVSKMLVSLIDKRLTKMKVNGEGLIQMASTMSEKKGSQWKKATTEEQLEYGTNGLRSYYRKDGKVKAMQVKIALQGDFEKLLYIKGKDGKSIATYITKTAKDGTKVKTLDYDTTLGKLNALMVDPVWKKENMDLFIMTTCRIPGQAMNSVEFMEIHSFLPKIAGNVIILPSEIVAKSGADYDVDKLFTMMANLGLYNGSVKKIKALPKEDINELNSKITGLKEKISNKKKELFDFIEANKDTLDEKQNLAEIKEARKSLKTAIASTSNKLTTKEKKALAENEKEVASLNAIIDSIYDTLGQKSSLFDELNAMNSELGDLQIRKDGQSIKGLENDLIDVIVERLEREDNYADLVRPNDTNLVDQIAADLESVVTPFNKYQVVHGNEGTKISSSMIFDPSYNRNKQIENSVGKDTLGIGAVINKYFSMFTRMGMYTNIDSNALTLDDYNDIINAIKEDSKNVSKQLKDLAWSYKNYNLHFPNFNTKTINGKQVVDLSSLKNNAGEYIPDILGQMINGWVDVAKGGWIFNIQGNKEATPTLLYLFMAGVPVEDAVNFVSVPAIRNYLEAKRVQQGALHVLNQNTTFDSENKDALLKYKDIDAYKSVVGELDIDSDVKDAYTNYEVVSLSKIMSLSINDNAPINTNAIKASLIKKGLNPLSDDVQFDLLNKFIAYENIAQQITSLTTATTFDTKASSRLNEVRDKQKKLDELVAKNSALPVDVLKRIDSTIVGKFASTDLILKLFSNFSALKNNKALVKAAESKSKQAFDSGVFPEDNINQYQEDFIWYLYQNESNRIIDNTYKGINLVEDESVDKYDYKDGELRYNPVFLNELAFGNESLNTIEHRFGSKNAALKFLAEYGAIDSVDLPKDSMHYTMAKKALSDLGINENTIEGKEITPEEYEELIAVAALESKALLASGNRETLMHGPFSYAKRLLEVVSEHGELKGNFKFLQDIRHNYNKYSHNILLANNKETGYSKIYRQELEILKAYGEIPEVQELFEQFDHFAVLQSGIRTVGQFNVTEIIDPAHISNVIGNQYNSILESLNKLNTGEAKNYSVLDLFTELNYPVDYPKRQRQNKRGGSYENDNYFKNEIEYTNKFDLSYLEGVRKIEIAMAKYATSAIIMPYAALTETEDAARQLEYFTALGERNINFDLGLYATAYINSSSEITDPKFVKEYFNKYKNHLDKLNHDNNLTFNIEMKPGVNGLIIAHLESLGYKKHPMLSSNGLYYAMSKVDSMPVSGLYNTQNTFSIKDDSLLSSSNKNEVVKVSIDQLVSKQLSDKYGFEEKYQAHKSLPNANWSKFIKANIIDNVAIESAYKYVVGKVIEKDKSFKSLLTNTQDAVLLQGDGQDKLNNMYARALMTARRSLVQIKAVESDPQQKAAVLTTSSGFLSAGTLPGFKRIEAITGAEIFDGEVFNKVESDKLFEIMDKEFPKVLADPAQGIPNFANTKSIYFGPIEYKYSTITKAPAALPSWLDKTVRELEKRMGVIPGYFDTALINRYTGLEQGLGMHTDAEPNLVGKENINPTVLTLSLGAERIFRLEGMSNTPYVNEKVGIPTKQGHVLVMGKDSQIKYKHGIEKNSGQPGIRYSITLRHTPDVNPVGRAVENPTGSINTQPSTSVEIKPEDITFKSNKLETFERSEGLEPVKGYSLVIKNQPNVDLFTFQDKKDGWVIIDNVSKNKLPLRDFKNGNAGTKKEITEALSNTLNYHSKKELNRKILEGIGFNFVTTQSSANPSDYTNHSGGAKGYDAEWDIIGEEFGMVNNKHYLLPSDGAVSDPRLQAKGVNPVDATNDVGPVALQGPATGEAQIAVTNAERAMGRIESNHTTRNTKKIRNYAQVKNADGIFAIGSLIPKGADITIARGQATKKALVPQVNGGTSVAVQLGITMGKPTYVFNQVANNNYPQGWYKWDNTKQDFVSINTPVLTKNFAGIGTSSSTTEAGKQAIKDVYTNTFKNTQSSTSVNEFDVADKLTPIEQNFKDGSGGRQMQSKFKDRSTMQLILSGDRTRTTRAKTDIERMMKDYNLSKIEDLVGKVIRMTDKKTGRAYTRITKVVPFTQEYQDATWEKEGWEKSVTDKHVGDYPYAIEFELVSRPVTAIALNESQRFTRESVEKDKDYAYLFTDNAARTSGSNLINPNSWYANTYGADKKFPGKTQAAIRGLTNGFPITTMVDEKRTQWTDEKFDEFKKEIDREIRRIKAFIGEGYFKGVKFSAEMPFGKGEISNMKDSAPKIWEYLNTKLAEIGIDNTGNTPTVITQASTTTTRSEDSYQYYGKPYAIVIENGVGVDVVGYKGKSADKNKLLAKYNENPNVDPQNGKAFRTEPTPVKVEEVPGNKPQVNRYELFPGVFANQGQSEAIDKLYDFISSNESEFVLEGAGGTGKTTLIKNLVAELESKGTVLAIGPTHKAKKVLDNSLNRDRKFSNKINTITLDAALAIKLDEATGEFKPNIKKRKMRWVPMLKADFVIIDEASMLKDDMLAEINAWKKKGAKIIYMGDRAQLPPVGQSSDSKVFGYSNHYLLTEKMRQAATSPIIGIGTVVSDNVKSKDPQVNVITSDMMVNTKDSVSGSELLWEQDEANAINQFVDDIKNSDDPNFAKIITFNNEKNPSGQSVLNLNLKVRNALYGLDAVKNQFMPGERLMAYDTFGDESPVFTNGEDLIVVSNTKKVDVNFNINVYSEAKGSRTQSFKYDVEYLDLINEEGVTLFDIPVIANSSINKFRQDVAALFKTDGQMAYGLLKEFGNLQYGYAITSHKAQGSTYTNTYVMLDNIIGNTNLGTPKAKNQSLYVAVSRPTTKLVMVTKTAPINPKSITVGAEKSKYDNDKIGC